MALAQYLTDTEALLHDFALQFYGSPLSLTSLINKGRLRIAASTQCIRVLLPKTGAVTSVTVSAGGTGYVTPVISGGSGSGATYSTSVGGGVITAITPILGGAGYVQGDSLTITGSPGSGATATANCAYTAFTTSGQEKYNFSTLSTIAQQTPGVDKIQGILSVSVSQGTITPTLDQKAFTELQAYMRAYNTSYTSYPEVFAQYSFGVNGSFYLWPVPSGTYGMDIDTYCLPISLSSDSDPEAIPYPWTECIPYYAAYWALMNAQRFEDAKFMKKEYDERILEARAQSTPQFIPSMYGEDY